jgi:hypothetical protein
VSKGSSLGETVSLEGRQLLFPEIQGSGRHGWPTGYHAIAE